MMSNHPTPYPEVNSVLNVLLPEVQAILGVQFIGMYLVGSLAYGGFDRESDVDFIVLTTTELPVTLFFALQELHSRIAVLDSWCATQLEGSYTPCFAMRMFDPLRSLYLHIDRGQGERLVRMQIEDPSLSRAWWGGWVLLRSVLWENGISLAGPNPRQFLNPVPVHELRQAALAILHGWVEPLLKAPDLIQGQAYQSYFVLTLCRIQYTLEQGAIVTKQVASRWAQARLTKRWGSLIERAWIGRSNPRGKTAAQDIQETQDFISFTLKTVKSHGFP